MKCQILFSGKNKGNITKLSSAELAQRVLKVNIGKPELLTIPSNLKTPAGGAKRADSNQTMC